MSIKVGNGYFVYDNSYHFLDFVFLIILTSLETTWVLFIPCSSLYHCGRSLHCYLTSDQLVRNQLVIGSVTNWYNIGYFPVGLPSHRLSGYQIQGEGTLHTTGQLQPTLKPTTKHMDHRASDQLVRVVCEIALAHLHACVVYITMVRIGSLWRWPSYCKHFIVMGRPLCDEQTFNQICGENKRPWWME